ncbi:hypothetical protein ABIB40_003933 [Pedobacter sp. UYP30]|uniref:YtxH domain-containing protein n=1 Tax=Pedobacter sp. UYP30 TaxID=1756400 RepID=UPI00339B040B
MGLIKNALLGFALYKGVQYLINKNGFGKSKLDELKDNAPKVIDKAKNLKDNLLGTQTFKGAN